MWPQIIFAGVCLLGMGIELARDGKPKEGNHSFMTTLVAQVITQGLLYWGGFYNVFFK